MRKERYARVHTFTKHHGTEHIVQHMKIEVCILYGVEDNNSNNTVRGTGQTERNTDN